MIRIQSCARISFNEINIIFEDFTTIFCKEIRIPNYENLNEKSSNKFELKSRKTWISKDAFSPQNEDLVEKALKISAIRNRFMHRPNTAQVISQNLLALKKEFDFNEQIVKREKLISEKTKEKMGLENSQIKKVLLKFSNFESSRGISSLVPVVQNGDLKLKENSIFEDIPQNKWFKIKTKEFSNGIFWN